MRVVFVSPQVKMLTCSVHGVLTPNSALVGGVLWVASTKWPVKSYETCSTDKSNALSRDMRLFGSGSLGYGEHCPLKAKYHKITAFKTFLFNPVTLHFDLQCTQNFLVLPEMKAKHYSWLLFCNIMMYSSVFLRLKLKKM